jgi:ubiquinone/menaquinone biosynthesis C-methylase UbiE
VLTRKESFLRQRAIEHVKKPSEGRFPRGYHLVFGRILQPIYRKTAAIARDHSCKTAVDLGCGTGKQCRHFFEAGCRTTGVDVSTAMLSFARKTSPPDIVYLQADIADTGLADRSCDCVNISLVLHATSPRLSERMLAEAQRIGNSDGIITITDYGAPKKACGALVQLPTSIVEACAVGDHGKNYREYMRQGNIDRIVKAMTREPCASFWFYGGVLRTLVFGQREPEHRTLSRKQSPCPRWLSPHPR